MDTVPLISVVMPSYQKGRLIGRAIQSVLNQSYNNWEILLVDNHSLDNTDQVVSSFNDTRIKVFKIHNKGVIAASRNVGIREASGEYIAFLDSDDWWKPEKLRLSLEVLNAGADIVYHDLFIATQSKQRFFCKKVVTRKLTKPVFDDLLANGNCINNSSVVVKKNLLTSIGGISEDCDLIASEDYDSWLRIAQLTDRFTRIPQSLGYYWAGGGNISSPEYTLKSIDAIEVRFSDSIHKLYQNHNIWWLNYTRGRAHYLLGAFGIAKPYLNTIIFGKSPVLVYLKSRWMCLFINRHLK